ncbi:MAG: DMT family transporter [Rhodovibrionaceae bacterium]|nr:DMT family transporter [Rhodovibrionaceae bacterium]
MSPIRQPTLADTLRLWALGAIWGSSFLFTEIAVATLPPLSVAAGRIALAACIVLGVAIALGQKLPRSRAEWAAIAGSGLFGIAMPFGLISWGQTEVNSSLAAILMGSGPFAALVLSHIFTRDDRFTAAKLGGLLLGFSGVAVLVGDDVLHGATRLPAQLAIVAAAFCYAAGGVITRRIAHLPTQMAAGLILLSAACYTIPLAVLVDRPWETAASGAPGLEALGAVIYLGLASTGVASLIRFQVIRDAGATFMAQVNYLVPLFGVFWAWLFLSQRPPLTAWIALALILAGIHVTRRHTGAGSRQPGKPGGPATSGR